MTNRYELFGITLTYGERPSDASVGAMWVMVILLAVVWIWFWLLYKFLAYIGRKLNHVRVHREPDDDCMYY